MTKPTRTRSTSFVMTTMLFASCSLPADPEGPNPLSIYDLTAPSLTGQPVDLNGFDGKVCLVVNVASECGYTPQYAGLQALQDQLGDRGLRVLGFPSNEFGGQEPGTADAIRTFCSDSYGVTFPMFAKVKTKVGAGQSPVYARLAAATGKQPGWNFCKYLVGRDGRVVAFFESQVTPESSELRSAIEEALRMPSFRR